MKRSRWVSAWALALATLLAGCVPPEPYHRPDPLTEKSVLRALKAVKATDDQRNAILAAFEDSQPKLAELNARVEKLREDYQDLSPRAPGYLDQAGTLAKQMTQADQDLMLAQAAFVHAVATQLSQHQWGRWLAFFSEEERPRYEYPDPRRRPQRDCPGSEPCLHP